MVRRCIALVTLFSFLVLPHQAAATVTATVGGPGGTPFQLNCPKDQVAVGFSARAGAWVDALALLCSSDVRGIRKPAGWVGGTHGSPQEVYCPAGTVITGLRMMFTQGHGLPRQYLNSIGLICSGKVGPCITTGEACDLRETSAGLLLDNMILADDLTCPDDEVMTGLGGRAGDYVDAIAAVCGARPGLIQSDTSAAAQVQNTQPQHALGHSAVQKELQAAPAQTDREPGVSNATSNRPSTTLGNHRVPH